MKTKKILALLLMIALIFSFSISTSISTFAVDKPVSVYSFENADLFNAHDCGGGTDKRGLGPWIWVNYEKDLPTDPVFRYVDISPAQSFGGTNQSMVILGDGQSKTVQFRFWPLWPVTPVIKGTWKMHFYVPANSGVTSVDMGIAMKFDETPIDVKSYNLKKGEWVEVEYPVTKDSVYDIDMKFKSAKATEIQKPVVYVDEIQLLDADGNYVKGFDEGPNYGKGPLFNFEDPDVYEFAVNETETGTSAAFGDYFNIVYPTALDVNDTTKYLEVKLFDNKDTAANGYGVLDVKCNGIDKKTTVSVYPWFPGATFDINDANTDQPIYEGWKTQVAGVTYSFKVFVPENSSVTTVTPAFNWVVDGEAVVGDPVTVKKGEWTSITIKAPQDKLTGPFDIMIDQTDVGSKGDSILYVDEITATDKAGNIYESLDSIDGPVQDKVAVTGIEFDAASLKTVEVGKTITVKAKVLPENATITGVQYKSSDTTILSVNATGVVRGLKAGKATITATSKDGGKVATYDITVTAAPGQTQPFNWSMFIIIVVVAVVVIAGVISGVIILDKKKKAKKA